MLARTEIECSLKDHRFNGIPALLILFEELTMRLAVLILGLLGAVGGGLIGLKWLSDASANEETIRKLEEYNKAFQSNVTTG
jgi:hypothetical protein